MPTIQLVGMLLSVQEKGKRTDRNGEIDPQNVSEYFCRNLLL